MGLATPLSKTPAFRHSFAHQATPWAPLKRTPTRLPIAMTDAELTVPSLDDGDAAEYDETAKKIPHYALPNVAAILPDFSNVEQETIMQAFRTGNCAQAHIHTCPTLLNSRTVAATVTRPQHPLCSIW